MTAGRPKKPIAQKRLEGTYRNDRDRDTLELDPIVSELPVPDSLTEKGAIKLWTSLLSQFLNIGLLSDIDLPLFEVMCKEYQKYLIYDRKVEENGGDIITLKNKSGYKYPTENPYLKLKYRALNKFTEIAYRFGMTPSDRAGITIDRKEDNSIENSKAKNF